MRNRAKASALRTRAQNRENRKKGQGARSIGRRVSTRGRGPGTRARAPGSAATGPGIAHQAAAGRQARPPAQGAAATVNGPGPSIGAGLRPGFAQLGQFRAQRPRQRAQRPPAQGSRTRRSGSDTPARAWWSIARGPRAWFPVGEGPGAGGRRKAPAATAWRAWCMRYGGRNYAQVTRRKKTGRAGPVFGVIRRAAVMVQAGSAGARSARVTRRSHRGP